MPGRKIVLATNGIYHVLNRGVASQPVFLRTRDYQRALDTLAYYQNRKLPFRYSIFLVQSIDRRTQILERLRKEKKFLVEIIAFCFMSNHFHFLLRQVVDNGISHFLSNFTNSYTRYFNTRAKRNGPLFQGKFKAIRIETEEQLLHVSRYIHLNPYTSYLVKDLKELEDYFYSSFPEYLGETTTDFCNKEDILGHFKKEKLYEKFVLDQAGYQRRLEDIKHLILEG